MIKLLLILLALSIGVKELACDFIKKVKYNTNYFIKISGIKNKNAKKSNSIQKSYLLPFQILLQGIKYLTNIIDEIIDNHLYSPSNLSQHIHIIYTKRKLLYSNNT